MYAKVALTAVAVVSLFAACGEEPRGAPPAPPAPPLAEAPAERRPRDAFSLRAGEVCARFYAEAAPLQAELQSAGPRAETDRRARARVRSIIREIQAGSKQFLRRLEAAPPPTSGTRRRDRDRLVASTRRFLDLQGENLDLAQRLIFEPDEASAGDKRRVTALRDELGAALVEQQTLLRRLDVPECLPRG